jgi:hypothetical protein
MNNSEITVKTVYTTADGVEFDSRLSAEHHIKVCNVLMNCFRHSPSSNHYQTIWELITHHKIVGRDDVEYDELCKNGDIEEVFPLRWYKE